MSDVVPVPPVPQNAVIYTAPPQPRVLVTFDQALLPWSGIPTGWGIRYPSWRRSPSWLEVVGNTATVRFNTTATPTVDNYVSYAGVVLQLVGVNGLPVEPFSMPMIPG